MDVIFFVVFAFAAVRTCRCQSVDELCQSALTVDCEGGYVPEGDETLCGSDNNTYTNQCYFVKEKCIVTDLKILYLGPCLNITTAETTTSASTTIMTTATMATSDILDEWQILKQVFCSSSATLVCDDSPNTICGSDKEIYFNSCFFAKAKCLDDSLSVLPLDQCTSIIGRRRKRNAPTKQWAANP